MKLPFIRDRIKEASDNADVWLQILDFRKICEVPELWISHTLCLSAQWIADNVKGCESKRRMLSAGAFGTAYEIVVFNATKKEFLWHLSEEALCDKQYTRIGVAHSRPRRGRSTWVIHLSNSQWLERVSS